VDTFFFHQPAFLFRDPRHQVISFYFSQQISIHFSEIDGRLISLPKSPFGGFAFEGSVTKESLQTIVDEVLAYSRSKKIKAVEIRCHPEMYWYKNSSLVKQVLVDAGFQLKYEDITQLLMLEQELALSKLRKRKLKGSEMNGFVFTELAIESLPQAYQLFLESRHQKGYPVTMTLGKLAEEFNRFSENYKLFGVLHQDKLIAASVVIIVNQEIVYYFFPGDALAYRKYSPTTYLICQLYNLFKDRNFKYMDLGISTDAGVLNTGLYNFKKSFGACDSLKLTFEKTITL
jgi:Acetyltransferase (GNAT) domain